MATAKQIEAALDDVQDDELVDFLVDTNEFAFLARAIVRQAMNTRNEADRQMHEIVVGTFTKDCVSLIRDRHWELAEKLANELKLNDRRAA